MLKKTMPTAASSENATVTKRVFRYMAGGALAGLLCAALLTMTCGFFFTAGWTGEDLIRVVLFPWRNEYVVVLMGYLSAPLITLGLFCGATLAVANE